MSLLPIISQPAAVWSFLFGDLGIRPFHCADVDMEYSDLNSLLKGKWGRGMLYNWPNLEVFYIIYACILLAKIQSYDLWPNCKKDLKDFCVSMKIVIWIYLIIFDTAFWLWDNFILLSHMQHFHCFLRKRYKVPSGQWLLLRVHISRCHQMQMWLP